MATAKGIDLTEDLELKIVDGDFKVSYSDQNHIWLIIKAYLGAFKQFPLVGVGVDYYLSSAGKKQELKRNISVQIDADGFTDIRFRIENNDFEVDATRILEAE